MRFVEQESLSIPMDERKVYRSMMNSRIQLVLGVCCFIIIVVMAGHTSALGSANSPAKILLGGLLMFDNTLSEPRGQSCAACHGPEVGWTGPDSTLNAGGAVYEGAMRGRFGNRKPPSAAYASFSPLFHYDSNRLMFVGGQFWDGRAPTLADQAKGPFLNPLEQNNPSAASVVSKVRNSFYAPLFRDVYGRASFGNIDTAYNLIADAIAAFEGSRVVNKFTSKYDYYLAGRVRLSGTEASGLQLFNGKAKCSGCHASDPGPYSDIPLFTDYTYDNLGVPKNPQNPFYGMLVFNPAGFDWIDPGLGGFLEKSGVPEWAALAGENMGKFKVPTLRNVDKRPYPSFVKAYSHNGYFKSLKDIVHFYNTRDVPSAGWPPPEVPENINTTQLGNLGLTDAEEWAIVAFLKTLSDDYVPSRR